MKILVLLSLLTTSIYAIDSLKCEQIISLMDQKKWDEAKSEIEAFRDIEDPEYYALVINYYFGKAERVTVDTIESEGSITMIDSTGREIYLSQRTIYDMDIINEGLRQFRPALSKFPSRLDLHLGFIYVARACGLYQDSEKALLNVLSISKIIDNKWLWSYNQSAEGGEEQMLLYVQAVINYLFEAGHKKADSAIIHVSEQMINLYPESVYAYNNLGNVYNMHGDSGKALIYFLKALKIAPDDCIVMANLADTYCMLENYQTAIYYLNKIIELGDEEYKAWANEMLKELGNINEEEMY